MAKCCICLNDLTDEEKKYNDDNKEEIFSIQNGYICRSHWCQCMPVSTPWRYLCQCASCDNYVCKECHRIGEEHETICEDCYNKLYNGNSENSDSRLD